MMEAMYFGDIEAFNTFIAGEYGKDAVEAMYLGYADNIDLAFTYYPSVNEYRGYQKLQIVVQNYCIVAKK